MPTITITFEHPQASLPKYKFGDRLAVKGDNPATGWLVGEIVGMALETEVFQPRWWYSIKLDFPPGYTEEYQEDELIPATEIPGQQQAQENAPIPLPKFQVGTKVRLAAGSGFSNFIKDFAIVVSSKYVTSKYWSGWTYRLINENLTSPISIGEIWLESVPSTTSVKP